MQERVVIPLRRDTDDIEESSSAEAAQKVEPTKNATQWGLAVMRGEMDDYMEHRGVLGLKMKAELTERRVPSMHRQEIPADGSAAESPNSVAKQARSKRRCNVKISRCH